MPVGEQRVRRVKTQTILETDMQFVWLNNYREVEVEVLPVGQPDAQPGKHVMGVCKSCADLLPQDSELLARFTETDLAQWRSEGAKITEQMDRRPTKVLRIDHQIT